MNSIYKLDSVRNSNYAKEAKAQEKDGGMLYFFSAGGEKASVWGSNNKILYARF